MFLFISLIVFITLASLLYFHKNFPIQKIFLFAIFFLLGIFAIEIFFLQNSFYPKTEELELILDSKNFSFDPLSSLGIFRSENGNFFIFHFNAFWIIFIKIFLFLLFGFFLSLVLKSKFSVLKILLFGFFTAFFLEILQIFIIFVADFFGFYYSGICHFGDVFLNFIGFCLGFFLYKISQKFQKK